MSEPTVLIRDRVRHSQRLSTAPLRPWVAVEDTELVICAHCNCMAGLGEVCCQISAVLITLEIDTKLKDSMSCTSLPCTWLPPSFQPVSYAPVSQINFTTRARRRLLPNLYQLAAVNHSWSGILLHRDKTSSIS